jgi:phosphate transport system permease protein
VSDPTLTNRSASSEEEPRGGSAELPPEAAIAATSTAPPPTTTPGKTVTRPGDRIFRSLAVGSGVLIVVLIAAIGLFLIAQAIPALGADNESFLTSFVWNTSDANNLRFGVLSLLWVTVASSVVALILAMPVALGIALFLTQYAPRRLARPFAYVVDLLAAVPSIIFGLWGIQVLAPFLKPFTEWLNRSLSWFPLFGNGNVSLAGGGNIFVAGVVLAVMVLPIITAVAREVFQRTPREHIEGALALGATKWEMIRTTVLPFGKAGYVSGAMLGLGRALGETMALLLILSYTSAKPNFSFFDGGATFASQIAANIGDANDKLVAGAYIAAGLVLFLLTFVVNAIARAIVAGHKEY